MIIATAKTADDNDEDDGGGGGGGGGGAVHVDSACPIAARS
jgi:hypothetical protein